MIKLKLHTGILLFLLTLLTACGSDEPYSKGSDYRELPNFEKSNTPQVVLFFSASCPHCYKFDSVFEKWVEKKPEGVVVERIPVNFGHDSWTLLQKAYATLRTLNIQDEMSLKMFEAVQDKNYWLGDAKAVASWLAIHGYDVSTTEKAYSSEQAKELLKAYYAAEMRYNVRGIPRAIVNGKYEIKIKSLEGEDDTKRLQNLENIIDYLLAKDE
ncbi:thiol:disulfide interchange protein DsbA/DsbL [Thalassotalea piscium]|uniref:Thiol:disulfide interchange protein n=1 Tax=Thalassotalea piscium TaxID=1230533 RepID=A0A7X0NJR4_9GAMM|nr:thiol:disulfide interchange protein DsbA/DsbL [Thalassotalea piscium]MBB6544747.1 thiol:disulfide interchange protein DsbA [Thalassotalea piscium]